MLVRQRHQELGNGCLKAPVGRRQSAADRKRSTSLGQGRCLLPRHLFSPGPGAGIDHLRKAWSVTTGRPHGGGELGDLMQPAQAWLSLWTRIGIRNILLRRSPVAVASL